MPTVPRWALGRDVSAAVITPQTIDAAGVLTATTPTAAMAAYWKNLRLAAKNAMDEVSASDQRRENNVILSTGTRYEVDVILSNSVVSASDFAAMFFGSIDYFKAVVTVGGHTWTFYGVAESWELKYDGKGAGIVSFAFAMVDPGSANPAFT